MAESFCAIAGRRLGMSMRSLFLVVSLVSQSTAQSIDDQIRAEVSRYVEAINHGNSRVVADLYLNDDGTSSISDGAINGSWRSISSLLRDVYAQVGSIAMTVDSVTVMPLGSDAALAVMKYRWVLGGVNRRRRSAR